MTTREKKARLLARRSSKVGGEKQIFRQQLRVSDLVLGYREVDDTVWASFRGFSGSTLISITGLVDIDLLLDGVRIVLPMGDEAPHGVSLGGFSTVSELALRKEDFPELYDEVIRFDHSIGDAPSFSQLVNPAVVYRFDDLVASETYLTS